MYKEVGLGAPCAAAYISIRRAAPSAWEHLSQALISGIFRHQATITLVLTMRNVQCLKQCIAMHQATITIVLTKVMLFAVWQVVARWFFVAVTITGSVSGTREQNIPARGCSFLPCFNFEFQISPVFGLFNFTMCVLSLLGWVVIWSLLLVVFWMGLWVVG